MSRFYLRRTFEKNIRTIQINMTSSLLGKWKLVKDGSDHLPGLDTLSDGPLILKLLGNQDIEFFKIEKKLILDVEEVHLSYSAKNISLTRGYQFGTCNYEMVSGKDILLASVQNCTEAFTELTVVRLGPKTGQSR